MGWWSVMGRKTRTRSPWHVSFIENSFSVNSEHSKFELLCAPRTCGYIVGVVVVGALFYSWKTVWLEDRFSRPIFWTFFIRRVKKVTCRASLWNGWNIRGAPELTDRFDLTTWRAWVQILPGTLAGPSCLQITGAVAEPWILYAGTVKPRYNDIDFVLFF